MNFRLFSEFKPTRDQAQAIEKLTKNLKAGVKHRVLLSVTRSGRTFIEANVIEKSKNQYYGFHAIKVLPHKPFRDSRNFSWKGPFTTSFLITTIANQGPISLRQIHV